MAVTAGSLAGKQRGDDDTLSGNNGDLIYGDAEMAITDNARGGNDILTIGGGHGLNTLIGDSFDLSGKGQGGHDSLTGGDQTSSFNLINVETGDAEEILVFDRCCKDNIAIWDELCQRDLV